jgi:hypothetical protein
MPNLGFYINKGSKDKHGFVTILAKISVNYKSHYKKIDKIKPRYWKTNSQRVSPNREGEPDNRHKQINANLDKYQNRAKDFFRYYSLNSIPVISQVVKDFLNGKNIVKLVSPDLNKAFQEYIDAGKGRKAYNTTRNITTILNFLKDYQKDTGNKIFFHSINMQLYDGLVDYCFNEKKIKNNYFAKIISVLKSFLIWATDLELLRGK